MRIKLRHVLRDVDRYGVVRFYFRKAKGLPKVRLPDDDRSPEFLKQYHALLGGEVAAVQRVRSGTFGWLIQEYQRTACRQLAKHTQEQRRSLFKYILTESVSPGSTDTYAEAPLSAITLKALKVLRDRKADQPEVANGRVKVLRRMFQWALEAEHVAVDPSRDLTRLKHRSDGYHTWTVEEVAQFEARWPVGTKERLALALLLWTGVRRSDVVQLGRQNVRDGWLAFTIHKTKQPHQIPVLPCLQEVIDATVTVGITTFLVSRLGTPFLPNSFGNWFAEACMAAGVPGRAHGLRKAGATLAAEQGATTHQLMAIFAWKTIQEAERYTKAANRRRMAGEGMELLVRRSQLKPDWDE